ncbi:MAG: hypothetical protein QOE90_1174 [Thermoplasmata archaeon]|jgi:hypothetical protein|nr:hypothetical protein [Thermoplasmata archaeon]
MMRVVERARAPSPLRGFRQHASAPTRDGRERERHTTMRVGVLACWRDERGAQVERDGRW